MVAAEKLATASYSSTGMKETTTVQVNYEDWENAVYRWRVQGWCITADSIDNCSIPDDVPELEKYREEAEGKYVFDSTEVFDYAVQQGVVPDYETGEVIVYAQPVLCVEEKKGDSWERTEEDIRSLEVWKSTRDWKGVARFKELYNLKLKVRISEDFGKKKVRGNTDTTVSEAAVEEQVGAVKTLKELGLTKTIKDGGKVCSLYGVKIEKALGGDGKAYSGEAFLDLESFESGVYKLTDGSSLIDANGHNAVFTREGFVLNNKQSGLYNLLESTEIRVGHNTVLTAYYSRNSEEYRVAYRQQFYNGANVGLDVSVKDTVRGKSFDDNISLNSQLNSHGLEKTVWHNGCNKWQLDSISFAKKGTSFAGDLGEPLSIEGGTEAGVVGNSQTVWENNCDGLQNQVLSLEGLGGDWVVQGNYVVYAPQVELRYYRDSAGELHLFSATSGGKEYSGIDSMQRSLYGQDGSAWGFSRFLEDQSVNGTARDLVLTEAYAYAGPSSNAVEGYLDDTRNCWGSSSLPEGGSCIQAGVNGANMSIWKCDRKNALQEALGDEKVITLSLNRVPINPLIYVGIYEQAPSIYCVSYVTNEEPKEGTGLTRYYAKPYSILYGEREYTGGEKVTVDCGTESLEAYRVYAQDGIDAGISNAGVSSIDDLRGCIDYGLDQTVYCTRYAWVTDRKVIEQVLALGNSVTYGNLKAIVGGYLEESGLGGRLFPEDGFGMLVKVFTPEVVTGNNAWKVSYLDVENGNDSGVYTEFKRDYRRLQRAQMVGDYRGVLDNSVSDGGYLKYSSVSMNGVVRKIELTNVGISTAPKSYPVDRGVGSGGGHSIAFHSMEADSSYAGESKSLIEKSNEWKVNPYSATDCRAVKITEYQNWLQGKSEYSSVADAWQWFVYKFSKSYSSAVVYEAEADEGTTATGYYTAEGYSKKELSPYTSSIHVSYEPFREDARTGEVYYLKGIYWGYSDEEVSTITEAELNSLTSSVSFCHGYSGGHKECNFTKSKSDSGYESSAKVV